MWRADKWGGGEEIAISRGDTQRPVLKLILNHASPRHGDVPWRRPSLVHQGSLICCRIVQHGRQRGIDRRTKRNKGIHHGHVSIYDTDRCRRVAQRIANLPVLEHSISQRCSQESQWLETISRIRRW